MLQGLQQKRFATLQVGLYTGVLLQVGKNSEFQNPDALPRCRVAYYCPNISVEISDWPLVNSGKA
jgi:hypothetical protein